MKKLLLILLCLPLLFSSCQQCKECEPSDLNQVIGYDQENEPIYAVIPFIEVCRDNFNSKQDYKNYIYKLETELGYSCKSDFWN
jgi:hypothetical protein